MCWCVSVGAAAGPAMLQTGREAKSPARDGGQEAASLGAGALQHSTQKTTGLVHASFYYTTIYIIHKSKKIVICLKKSLFGVKQTVSSSPSKVSLPFSQLCSDSDCLPLKQKA